jgi:hypothetical protein
LEDYVIEASYQSDDWSFVPLSAEELTDLALSADVDAPIDLDVEPWDINKGFSKNPLPDWYMPRPIARGRGRPTRLVVYTVVGCMLIIAAFGLCITSGFLSLA